VGKNYLSYFGFFGQIPLNFNSFRSLNPVNTAFSKNILATPEFGPVVALYIDVLSITVRVGYAAGTETYRG
jgi:hypothetical protein